MKSCFECEEYIGAYGFRCGHPLVEPTFRVIPDLSTIPEWCPKKTRECKNAVESGEHKCQPPTYKCPRCGALYCQECASEMHYTCDCVTPPRLRRL